MVVDGRGVGGRQRVDHGGERVERRLDQLGRVLGGVGRVGDDHRHRLPDEAHHALGQLRPRRRVRVGVLDRWVQRRDGDVVGPEHGDHAGDGPRRLEVERLDPAVGDRAAEEPDVQHAFELEVVDELGLSGEQGPVLAAQHAPPDRLVIGVLSTASAMHPKV